jgi:cephalosporin hydroxylase
MHSNKQTNFSCKVLEDMLETKQTTGKSGKIFQNLPALSTLNNLRVIQQLMDLLNPINSLEIGFAFGGSGLVFTNWYLQKGLKENRQHTAIDPFQHQLWDDSGLLAIECAGLAGYLEHIEGFSSIALPRLLKETKRYSIIYIDGSHIFEDVFIDFYYCARLLDDQGCLLLDDSTDKHVAKVIHFIRTNCRGFLKEMDLGKLLKFDKKRLLKYRLARLLNKNQLTAFKVCGHPTRPWNVKFTDF